jgi:hypothetical protein
MKSYLYCNFWDLLVAIGILGLILGIILLCFD